MENLHCNFHSVENSNCTYHIVENITKYIPYCGKYQDFFQKLFNRGSFVSILSVFQIVYGISNSTYLAHCTLWNINYSTSSFYIVISTIRKIQIVLTTLWKISKGAFHIVEILIVNSLEHLFHISSFESTD